MFVVFTSVMADEEIEEYVSRLMMRTYLTHIMI